MDKILKEFELLSLPSRVNLESLSDDCIDKLLENINLLKVFEALKGKGDKATPFQWRKLREACLISKSAMDMNFMIEVYEEAFRFNLGPKGEMAECHISISKLIEFYDERKKFNETILGLIILFRFYYAEGEGEGLAEVAGLLGNKVAADAAMDIVKSEHIQSILNICISNQNYWLLKKNLDRFDKLEQSLINSIAEKSRKSFILAILKSYPLVPVSWVQTLLNTSGSCDNVQEIIKEETGRLIELNEAKDKFIIKKRKQ